MHKFASLLTWLHQHCAQIHGCLRCRRHPWGSISKWKFTFIQLRFESLIWLSLHNLQTWKIWDIHRMKIYSCSIKRTFIALYHIYILMYFTSGSAFRRTRNPHWGVLRREELECVCLRPSWYLYLYLYLYLYFGCWRPSWFFVFCISYFMHSLFQ